MDEPGQSNERHKIRRPPVSTRRTDSQIDALTAPNVEGQTLIWPQASGLIALAEENRGQRERYAFTLLGRPASGWCAEQLKAGLVFMTGHQPAFFHPGVWAKNIATSALAEYAGGEAHFLVVDSDVPHRIAIPWPDDAGPLCRARTSAVAAATNGRSYEHLTDLPAEDYAALFAGVPEPWRSPNTAFSTFEAGFLHATAADETTPANYVWRWAAGMQQLEQALGVVSPMLVRVSDLFTPAYGAHRESAQALVGHLLLAPEAFATAYNKALDNYRTRRGIRGQHHPIPDLFIDGDRIELPFWMVHPLQPRERLAVSRESGGQIRLWSGAQPAGAVSPADLLNDCSAALAGAIGDWQIRPRALAQTMFARLFACDLFIHGIGGAKYDQITDDIIRGFFGVEPPAYACISATLRLPLRRYEIGTSELRDLRHKARDLRYNPQRYLPDDRSEPKIRHLIAARAAAIEASNRLGAERPKDRSARLATFNDIRQANAGLMRAAPDLREKTARQITEIAARSAHNRITTGREWFFALHPKDDLARLRDTLRGELGETT